jgi:hypothetical protein
VAPSPFQSFFYAEAAVIYIADTGSGPAPFWQVFVLPGPAAQLRIVAGNDQAGTTGQPLGIPLQVQVIDQFSNGVAGQMVTWTVSGGGGSLAAPSTVSGDGGLTENIWTLGPSAGTQTVTASFGEVTVMFSANASSGG